MKILGISAYYPDSAAALVVDGVIVSASQEERFTRIKHDLSFQANAIKYCLSSEDVFINTMHMPLVHTSPPLTKSLLSFDSVSIRSKSTDLAVDRRRCTCIFGAISPAALNPVYKLWMKFGLSVNM